MLQGICGLRLSPEQARPIRAPIVLNAESQGVPNEDTKLGIRSRLKGRDENDNIKGGRTL